MKMNTRTHACTGATWTVARKWIGVEEETLRILLEIHQFEFFGLEYVMACRKPGIMSPWTLQDFLVLHIYTRELGVC